MYLIYRLANDWADNYGLPLEERLRLRQQMKDAYDEVFLYHVGGATDYHNLHGICNAWQVPLPSQDRRTATQMRASWTLAMRTSWTCL